MLSALGAAGAALAAALCWLLVQQLQPSSVLSRRWATRGVPEPGGHWLLGHLLVLLERPGCSYLLFQQWARDLGPVYRIRFLLRPVLVVTAPALYQPLLRPGPHKLHKHLPPYAMFNVFARPPRANILSSLETSPTWRSVRRAAASALTMSHLRAALPHINVATERLVAELAAAGPDAAQDLDAAAQRVTVDVVGLAAFDRDLRATGGGGAGAGVDAGCRVLACGPAVVETMRHLVVAMQARNNPLNRWFSWRKAARDLVFWGGRMSALVEELLADLEAEPPPPHTLAAHLLACRDDTGAPLEREQILAELGLFWGAAFETTAHTICWTLALVATTPGVEARVAAELGALGLLASPERPRPPPLAWEQLSQLRYLSAVINESMRLYPVVSSGTIRVTHAPMRLGSLAVPPGQPILIPTYAIHRRRGPAAVPRAGAALADPCAPPPPPPPPPRPRSPALWDEPDAFRPERWLQQAGGDDGLLGGGYVDVAADADADVHARSDQGAKRAADRAGGALAAPAKPSSGLEIKDAGAARRGFLPFSAGTRSCAGSTLAVVELKTVLAQLLGNFVFELDAAMGGMAGVAADARQMPPRTPTRGPGPCPYKGLELQVPGAIFDEPGAAYAAAVTGWNNRRTDQVVVRMEDNGEKVCVPGALRAGAEHPPRAPARREPPGPRARARPPPQYWFPLGDVLKWAGVEAVPLSPPPAATPASPRARAARGAPAADDTPAAAAPPGARARAPRRAAAAAARGRGSSPEHTADEVFDMPLWAAAQERHMAELQARIDRLHRNAGAGAPRRSLGASSALLALAVAALLCGMVVAIAALRGAATDLEAWLDWDGLRALPRDVQERVRAKLQRS
ncbi:Cyp3a9 [Scenedesmus sp. PABB004]|nr:Cyp3a9 [Scenedesmus sp. PABB004]